MSTRGPEMGPQINMLNRDQKPYNDRWLEMKPIISDLLCQKDVSKQDWHKLFWHAHQAVTWLEEGYILLQERVKNRILISL